MYDDKLPPKRIRLDRYHALHVTWRDDSENEYPVAYLRAKCPCASCRETRADDNPLRVLSDDMLDTEVAVTKMNAVGRYAVNFEFSDGHATGIYSFEYLCEIATTRDPSAAESVLRGCR
jgi:DUF971 family protein